MTQRRQLVLGGALVATLTATAWLATRPDEEVAPVAAPTRRSGVAASAATAAAPLPASADRQPWAEAPADQLAAWQPPPPPPAPPAPPPVAAAPPPPPVAPPPPYQMIGRVVEGEGAKAVEVALLTGPNKALSAKRGDVIDGQWRVEQVSDSGVRLTWLPGQLPQNIAFRPIP
ncbi:MULTISPECIES: hypothetical protein [unclassified Roseateles]|uniref:hypothetical protein n=1 Tax=unclassified Roseateles TaxID=2626991 RepID=UPI0006F41DAB|nr:MULTISPECIES: hypothetical protein [unclassified Roseateles]KQW45642.1 hypothetical protein ASC81_12170 [Pelomonas sp. Root405]KRA72486.1 hypothetical protein ASD88_12170 [Pelomonas sp. Root662]